MKRFQFLALAALAVAMAAPGTLAAQDWRNVRHDSAPQVSRTRDDRNGNASQVVRSNDRYNGNQGYNQAVARSYDRNDEGYGRNEHHEFNRHPVRHYRWEREWR
jgi:hypothetical protein